MDFSYRLVIINRVYLFSGSVTEQKYQSQKMTNLGLYVFFVVVTGSVHLVFLSQDFKINFSDEDSKPLNDIDLIPSEHTRLTVTSILSALTISFVIIGSFLVNRLRHFFKDEYYKHSNSILISIFLMILSIGAMMSVEFIKTNHIEELKRIQEESL